MRMSASGPIINDGDLDARGLRIGCVVSRFNSFITDRLLSGAMDAIRRHGGAADAVRVVRVPGSLELATAARAMADSGNYDALICLGAVIRGETDHYDHVASGAASGITRIGPETGVPTIFGVLTCHNTDQAIDRSGGKSGNAGFQAAVTAIEMASVLKELASE